MSSIKAQRRRDTQVLGRFPELTSVQWAFPNPFPRAGDITPPLGKASLPLLWGIGYRLSPLVLLPLQLSDDVSSIGGLESALRESEALLDEFEFGGEHLLLLDELA